MAKKKDKSKKKRKKNLPATDRFELSAALELGSDARKLFANELKQAGEQVSATVETALRVDPETGGKEKRELERAARKLSKTFSKSVPAVGQYLLKDDLPSLDTLLLAEDGNRVRTPVQELKVKGSLRVKMENLMKTVLEALTGENPLYKRFRDAPGEIRVDFGSPLSNNFFLMGHFLFRPDLEKAAASTLSMTFDVQEMVGKQMGRRMVMAYRQDLDGNFSAEGHAELPLTPPQEKKEEPKPEPKPQADVKPASKPKQPAVKKASKPAPVKETKPATVKRRKPAKKPSSGPTTPKKEEGKK